MNKIRIKGKKKKCKNQNKPVSIIGALTSASSKFSSIVPSLTGLSK